MKTHFYFFLTILLAFGLTSCGGEEVPVQKRGKGDVWLGGILKIQSAVKVNELFPHSGTNKFTRDVTYQIFESLLRFDPKTMETKANVAKDFSVSNDGLKYILNIRNDVYFHPNDCFENNERLLTVEDVKFSLDLACSGLKTNKSSFLLTNRIKGAKEYNSKTRKRLGKEGVEGIRITGKNQITIELVAPFAGFEKVLAHSNLGMVAKEAFETYGSEILTNPVGTGPFMLEELTNESIKLKRFPKYWRKDKLGNRLPYLDGVIWTYYTSKQKELAEFQNQTTDIVLNIPVDEINNVLGSLEDAQEGKNVIHKVYSEPSMSVTYLGYANESEEFGDVRVRKAFNQAINRKELINNWLGGEGIAAENGFVPPLDFYPNQKVMNVAFDTLSARRLLAEAGYPNGEGFPKIQIYVNAQKNSEGHNLVKGIQKQLKQYLNIDLGIKLCSITERDKAIAEGKAKIWRAGWIADYPHPENFLSLFYSRNISSNNNTINSFLYKNQEFDDLLEAANKEQNEDDRNALFVQCDQKIIDDAAVMPILTGDLIILVNKKVKNTQANPMELLDISSIFIRPPR